MLSLERGARSMEYSVLNPFLSETEAETPDMPDLPGDWAHSARYPGRAGRAESGKERKEC